MAASSSYVGHTGHAYGSTSETLTGQETGRLSGREVVLASSKCERCSELINQAMVDKHMWGEVEALKERNSALEDLCSTLESSMVRVNSERTALASQIERLKNEMSGQKWIMDRKELHSRNIRFLKLSANQIRNITHLKFVGVFVISLIIYTKLSGRIEIVVSMALLVVTRLIIDFYIEDRKSKQNRMFSVYLERGIKEAGEAGAFEYAKARFAEQFPEINVRDISV